MSTKEKPTCRKLAPYCNSRLRYVRLRLLCAYYVILISNFAPFLNWIKERNAKLKDLYKEKEGSKVRISQLRISTRS